MATDEQMNQPTPQVEVPKQTPPTIDEPVPSIWPGAFGAYKYSKAAILYNLGTFLGLIVLSMLISIASSLVSGDRTSFDGGQTLRMSGMGSVINILAQLVGIWVGAAMTYLLVASVKRQKTDVSDSLRESWKIFLPYLGLNILVGLISLASVLLLVVPAFFVIPRLVLAQYFLIEGKLGVTESITASWNATRGNVGKVWGIVGFNILLVLLAITIVGIPFTIYFGLMYQAVSAVLYLYLKNTKPAVSTATQTGPTAPVPPSDPTV